MQRQRQHSARFKIHRAPQRSKTCNRLSDVSSQAPKPQPHFLFFPRPPLFPFLPRALGCCREIRSSDKTRRVEGGWGWGRTLRGEKRGEACFSSRWKSWFVVRNRNANEHAGRHAGRHARHANVDTYEAERVHTNSINKGISNDRVV